MNRPRIDPKLLSLFHQIAIANPPWEAPRICDELRELGPDDLEKTISHNQEDGLAALLSRAAALGEALEANAETVAELRDRLLELRRDLVCRGDDLTSSHLWDFLVRYLQRLGCASEAVASSIEAISLGLWSEEFLLRSVELVLEDGCRQVAYDCLIYASSRAVKTELIHQVEAKILYELGQPEAAILAAMRALDLNPANGPATGIRILSLLESDRLEQAVEVFAAASGQALDCCWAVDRLVEELGQAHRDDPDLSGLPLDVHGVIEHFLDHRRGEEVEWQRLRLLDLAGLRKEALELADRIGDACGRLEAPSAKRVRARVLLELGLLGRGGRVFADVLEDPGCPADLRQRLPTAMKFLSDFKEAGLGLAGREVRTPEALYDYLVARQIARPYAPVPGRVALIGATLACGGAERVLAAAYAELRRLRNLDPRLWLYSTDPAQGHDFYQRIFGLDRQEIRIVSPTASEELPFALLPTAIAVRAYPLYRAFLEERPAVVHGWQDSVSLEMGFAALLAGVPQIVMHPHNLRPDAVHRTRWVHSYRACYRALLTSPRVRLLCVSEASLRDYEEWLGMRLNGQGHVIANGFEFALAGEQDLPRLKQSLRVRFGLPSDSFVVGAAIRFAAVKRPLLWIETIAVLRQDLPNLKAILFGDGELRRRMERRIKELGLGDVVQLAGWVDDAPVAMAALDVCLLTSATEGLPSTVIEAQVAGVPVVAPRVGGTSECLLDGETGILCDDDSAAALASAVLRIAKEPEWRAAAVEKGRPHAVHRFDLGLMTQALTTLYDVAESRRSAAAGPPERRFPGRQPPGIAPEK